MSQLDDLYGKTSQIVLMFDRRNNWEGIATKAWGLRVEKDVVETKSLFAVLQTHPSRNGTDDSLFRLWVPEHKEIPGVIYVVPKLLPPLLVESLTRLAICPQKMITKGIAV